MTDNTETEKSVKNVVYTCEPKTGIELADHTGSTTIIIRNTFYNVMDGVRNYRSIGGTSVALSTYGGRQTV